MIHAGYDDVLLEEPGHVAFICLRDEGEMLGEDWQVGLQVDVRVEGQACTVQRKQDGLIGGGWKDKKLAEWVVG